MWGVLEIVSFIVFVAGVTLVFICVVNDVDIENNGKDEI